MSGELLYLDSSALVKLILPEAETDALLRELDEWPSRITSTLAVVEVLRAVRRASRDAADQRRAEKVIAGLPALRIDDAILDQAALLEPRTLRALDALHLASALSLAGDLGAMVVYDHAFAAAAAAHGLRVLSPGRV